MCAAKKQFISRKKKKTKIVIVVMTRNSLFPLMGFPFPSADHPFDKKDKEKKEPEGDHEEEEV